MRVNSIMLLPASDDQGKTGFTLSVGITDDYRWDYEISDGMPHGGNAATHMWVDLTDYGRPWALVESIGFMCPPGNPQRPACLATIPALLKLTREMYEQISGPDPCESESDLRNQWMGTTL